MERMINYRMLLFRKKIEKKILVPLAQKVKFVSCLKTNKLIIDVGSGMNPQYVADVCTDAYADNRSRGSDLKIPYGCSFVFCDIINMPFVDKRFSFAYCNHVVEHLEDPIKGCAELSRIAEAGIITCPTKLWELCFGRHYHKWFVSLEGDTLIFERKPNNFINTGYGDTLYSQGGKFCQMFQQYQDQFNLNYKWSGKIKAKIIESSY